MKRAHSIFLSLLLTIAAGCGLATAQQKTADSVLAYFPKGNYMMISHYDISALENSTIYPFFRKNFIRNAPVEAPEKEAEGKKSEVSVTFVRNNISVPTVNYNAFDLPESMLHDVMTATIGTPLRFAIQPEATKNAVQQLEIQSDQKGAEKTSAVFVSISNVIGVYELYDLQQAMQQAISDGHLVTTSKKIGGRPLYTYSKTVSGARAEKFIMTTPDNKLLLAKDIKTLRKMYQSGNRRIPSVVDNEEYIDLLNIFHELGPVWRLTSSRQSGKELVEAMMQGDVSQERMDEVLERTENQPFFSVNSVTPDKSLLVKTYTVYETDEAAEEQFEQESSRSAPQQLAGNSPEFLAYQAELKRRSNTELLGNIVYTSLTYDEELLAMQKKANEALVESLKANSGTIQFRTEDGKTLKMKMEQVESGEGKKEKK